MSNDNDDNVVSLAKFKKDHELTKIRSAYVEKISSFQMIQLLEEMVRFQEARTRLGVLTPQMMIEGQILFHTIEENCNTDDMRVLAGSYKRHLYHEYEEFLKKRNHLRLV